MRILMTTDTVGGVWSYSLDLASALKRHGIDTVLAVLGPEPRRAQEAAARDLALPLHVKPLRLEWMEGGREDIRAANAWLAQLARRLAPDVLHLNSYAQAHVEADLPKVVVAHSCVLSWWQAVRGSTHASGWAWYREMVSGALAHADAVVAPSAAMLGEARRIYGLPRSKGRVIYNGVAATPRARRLKERTIFCAGRLWDEAKNLGVLRSAARALPWPLYSAGWATPPEHAASKTPGPPASVQGIRWLGELDRATTRTWMARASIFALPARYEPFGLTALEAGMSGAALVLADIPSLREIWEGAAEFVAPDDAAGWTRTLGALVDDPLVRARSMLRALERARHLTNERMAERYAELYLALTSSRAEAAKCAS